MLLMADMDLSTTVETSEFQDETRCSFPTWRGAAETLMSTLTAPAPSSPPTLGLAFPSAASRLAATLLARRTCASPSALNLLLRYSPPTNPITPPTNADPSADISPFFPNLRPVSH